MRGDGAVDGMNNALSFYIGGAWVASHSGATTDVLNPATEERLAAVALGDEVDVDRAVAAARAAFPAFSRTSREDRLALLKRIVDAYRAREEEMSLLLTRELGVPLAFCREWQVPIGRWHLETMVGTLETYPFEEPLGTTMVVREAIGVAGMITPWNWPLNQIICKVAPALAAGCCMVLKPSEVTPLTSLVLAEVLHDAGVPAGVFNLVNGDGAAVGQALASHPGVDMVSFTGSTRAGIQVAKLAADGVKRVSQELGGKSANILLPDADLEEAVRKGVAACFSNSGQSCNAPTRMLVHRDQHDRAAEIAAEAASAFRVGDPMDPDTDLGPVVSKTQFDRIQALIRSGIEEGARPVAGGPGKPEGLDAGYFVRPTVFAAATPGMRIAREEIFGPVLTILSYEDEAHAIELANDSEFGLAAYVQSRDLPKAREIARRMQSGQVFLNYPDWDRQAPFGGYKKSGNGREYARFGLEDFLETKAVVGYR